MGYADFFTQRAEPKPRAEKLLVMKLDIFIMVCNLGAFDLDLARSPRIQLLVTVQHNSLEQFALHCRSHPRRSRGQRYRSVFISVRGNLQKDIDWKSTRARRSFMWWAAFALGQVLDSLKHFTCVHSHDKDVPLI